MADRGRKAFPISSPIIFEHDCEQRYKIHKNRVRSARAVINTAPPEDFLHFHYNAKKCMQQAERMFDIERANRILLEKMTKYAEYNGAEHLRPWASRGTVNFKNGMLYRPGTGLHIDNLNVPVNNGFAAGNRKTDYLQRKELLDNAKENMRIREKIQASKPVYSAQKLQHEYLENVSRIDRLSTFRGPRSASHRSVQVKENMNVAKSMRSSQHLPGTVGYQKELSRSIKHQRSQSARTSGKFGGSAHGSGSEASDSHSFMNTSTPSSPQGRPPRAQSAVSRGVSIKGGTAIHAYAQEAARSMKRATTFSRSASRAQRSPSGKDGIAHSTSTEPERGSHRPISGRRSASGRAPLLTPDASVTMVSADDSREGDRSGAAPGRSAAAPSIMAQAPQRSFDV